MFLWHLDGRLSLHGIVFFLDPKDSIVHVVTLTKKDCWVQNVMTMLNIGYPSKVQCEKNQVSISVNLLKEKAADTLGVTSMLSNSVNNKYSCDRRMKNSVTTLLFSAHPLLLQLMSPLNSEAIPCSYLVWHWQFKAHIKLRSFKSLNGTIGPCGTRNVSKD